MAQNELQKVQATGFTVSSKPETVFRRQVCAWIDEQLVHCVRMTIQQVALCGTPDLLLCLNGRFVALELKAEDGKATALQRHILDKIISKGRGVSFVAKPSNWLEIQKRLLEIDGE